MVDSTPANPCTSTVFVDYATTIWFRLSLSLSQRRILDV